MKPQLVPLDSVPRQPWKNGGGSTRELLTWPLGQADWALRISVASIDCDGPFSSMPGIERWFAVVSGPGVALSFGSSRREQRPGDPPCSFDGAAAPGCTMLGAPTQDLNLMVRASAGQGLMQVAEAHKVWWPRGVWHAVYAADDVALHLGDVHTASLPAGTLAFMTHAQDTPWHLAPEQATPMRAWWMSFAPAQPGVSP